MATVPQVLGDDHCKCLDKVLESIPPAMALAQACTECGWDVQDFINQLKDQQAKATKAKAIFFPDRK